MTDAMSPFDPDARSTDRFWVESEAAASWRDSLTVDQRQHLLEAEAEVDHAFDGIN